jgi:hypothetical protein
MNTTRKIERRSDGLLVATLTPEEQAEWEELHARLEQVEIAWYDARRAARKALGEAGFYEEYREAILAQIHRLKEIQLPELYRKQSTL